MRKTTKKPRSAKKQTGESAVKPMDQSLYINVREVSPELQKKQAILWILVLIFSLILITGWLFVLRFNIKKESDQLNFNQLGQQISESLARFDTEIKDRNKPQAINIDDLNSLKDNLEEEIKNNPDSSLWPTHEFTKLGLILQYPTNWQKISENKNLLIGDSTTTDEFSDYGKITIAIKDNSKRLALDAWLAKNADLKNFQPEKPIFIFSSTTPENYSYLKINLETTATSTLNRIYFINATSSKKVIEIKTESRGDDKYYKPLAEEIIRTIKLN